MLRHIIIMLPYALLQGCDYQGLGLPTSIANIVQNIAAGWIEKGAVKALAALRGCLLRGLMINLLERAYYFARRIYAPTVGEHPGGRDQITGESQRGASHIEREKNWKATEPEINGSSYVDTSRPVKFNPGSVASFVLVPARENLETNHIRVTAA